MKSPPASLAIGLLLAACRPSVGPPAPESPPTGTGADEAATAGQPAPGPAPPAEAGAYTVSGPYTHKNLSVFLIHGQDRAQGKGTDFLTLQEALDEGKVVVHETGDVNQLTVENVSSAQVYVQAGDIVKGGQQDRVFATDLVLGPGSGRIPVASFCVERGRWTRRGREAVTHFGASSEQLATRELKLAATYARDQNAVWSEVTRVQTILTGALGEPVASSHSPSSLQLSLENEEVQGAAEEYAKAILPAVAAKDNVTGLAFAVGGELNSADVYASQALFRKLLPRMLKAAAVEAVAKLKPGEQAKAPDLDKVKHWLETAEAGKASEQKVSDRVRAITRESEADIVFETCDLDRGGEWVHRSYLRK